MLYVYAREKSRSDLEVEGGEGFQGFDLHPEVLIRVHSSHRVDERAFQEEQMVRAEMERGA